MSLPPGLRNAASQPVTLTVAELLRLFGRRNRDFETVGMIDAELAAAGLCCEPPLDQGGLGSSVTVRAIDQQTGPGADEEPAEPAEPSPVAPRISDLPSARLGDGLVGISPEDNLAHARALMMHHRFSQLPILAGPTVLKGVVSWETIAKAHARGQCEILADATEPASEVHITADLLTTIPDIYNNGHVFVRDEGHKVSGIVTAADLSLEFGRLTGPFLRLGELERRLRRCVEKMCPTVQDLRDACGSSKVSASYELTVGQIQRVFQKPERWQMLNWGIPQNYFLDKLEEVRHIRNEVAHFRPNPLTDEQINQLEKFAGMVKSLQP